MTLNLMDWWKNTLYNIIWHKRHTFSIFHRIFSPYQINKNQTYPIPKKHKTYNAQDLRQNLFFNKKVGDGWRPAPLRAPSSAGSNLKAALFLTPFSLHPSVPLSQKGLPRGVGRSHEVLQGDRVAQKLAETAAKSARTQAKWGAMATKGVGKGWRETAHIISRA